MTLLLLLACSGGTDDTGEPLCPGGDVDPAIALGYGLGGDFTPYSDGEVVGMTSAPQGGFGVPVRVQTEGLRAAEGTTPNAPISVELTTVLDGEVSASFLNDTATIYCQDSGSGLVWDLVVGFDTQEYSSVDDLISLHGRIVDLEVAAFDADGREANTVLTVEITAE